MLLLHVFLEFTADTELRQAVTADMRSEHPPTCMTMHVFAQVLGPCKGFRTRGASVWLVAVVQFDVTAQVPDARKQRSTNSALKLHDAVDVADIIRLRVFHVVCLDCIETQSVHK